MRVKSEMKERREREERRNTISVFAFLKNLFKHLPQKKQTESV